MQSTDFKWFKDNYDLLSDQYGPSFLVIKDKKVIGTYDSYGDAVEKTVQNEALGTFIVQKCNGSVSAYTTYIAPIITA